MSKILVVDDNPVDSRIAGGFVEEMGSTVTYAKDGLEALEKIQTDKPDVVLTDLRMPKLNGLELVERIRDEHPDIPVVLMTAHGSEDAAAAALKAGAASYVPKRDLKAELDEALRTVLAAVEAQHQRERVREFLQLSKSEFVMGCELDGVTALVSFLEGSLARLNFCDRSSMFQINTALAEALANAVDHGNLELDSALRETENYEYGKLRIQRAEESPYRDRRVHVTATLTPGTATYIVRDEGTGFDRTGLPDPRDPENLLKPSGRGLTLIHMFMDEVSFNDRGNEITMVKRAAV